MEFIAFDDGPDVQYIFHGFEAIRAYLLKNLILEHIEVPDISGMIFLANELRLSSLANMVNSYIEEGFRGLLFKFQVPAEFIKY